MWPKIVYIRALISRFIFGTSSIHAMKYQQLLPSTTYATEQFGMLCLEEENYKYPVKIKRSSCNCGHHLQPEFGYGCVVDGVVSGDGRVFDRRHRLVSESVASHHQPQYASNPGILRTRKASQKSGCALNLNWWSGNTSFYHWNRDVFSRAFVVTALDPSTPLNVVIPPNRLPFQEYALNQLSMIYGNIHLIEQHLGEWTRYDEVVVPRCNSTDVGSGFLHPEVADFIRSVNFYNIPETTEKVPVLYISRAKASHRRLLDEGLLIERLSRIVPLKVVSIEDFSYVEQMRLMSGVGVLVGPFGAGLTNILFTKRLALVEIHNSDSRETHFATLSLACKSRYVQIRGGRSDLYQDFYLGQLGIDAVCKAVTSEISVL